MRAPTVKLYDELSQIPEDWSVRLRLIERAIEQGNREEAKRLVRESPDEGPLPEELQRRVFELMTRDWPPLERLPRAHD